MKKIIARLAELGISVESGRGKPWVLRWNNNGREGITDLSKKQLLLVMADNPHTKEEVLNSVDRVYFLHI
jgi:hypothetical protein